MGENTTDQTMCSKLGKMLKVKKKPIHYNLECRKPKKSYKAIQYTDNKQNMINHMHGK